MNTSAVGIALQPIVDLKNRDRPAHYEALLRIFGSARFGSSHVQLIGAAEQEGWIDEVDLVVLCEAVTVLRTVPGVSLAVNLSPRTIDLAAQRVLRLLRDCHDVTNRLILEVTETAPINDIRAVCRFYHAAKDLGTRLALDDYGSDSGFISRELVVELAPDFLKLDRVVTESPRAQNSVLPSALGLAHQVGAEVVAEFIDSQAKVDLVRSCGIRYAQGAMFGMPQPSSEFFADALAAAEGLVSCEVAA